jgi:hypothetical protein
MSPFGSGSDDPYSVYDLARNAGWLNVNIDHDTTGFGSLLDVAS